MPAPAASVLLLSFNQSAFIHECVRAFALQSFRDFEVIAVDDASADGSAELLRQALGELEQPTKLICHTKNRGICASLNEALSLARGRYVSIIAADDTFAPRKLEIQVALLDAAAPDVAFVYSDANQISGSGEPLPATFLEQHCPGFVPPTQRQLFDALISAKHCFLPIMAMLIRADAIRAVGCFDESLVYEDWDLLLRLTHKYRGIYSPHASCNRRVHSASLSKARARDLRSSTVRLLAKWRGESAGVDAAISRTIDNHAWWLLQTNPREARLPLRIAYGLNPSLRAALRLARAYLPSLRRVSSREPAEPAVLRPASDSK